MFKATPLLANEMSADELAGILEVAKKAVETSDATECRFDENGNPTPDGFYETWLSADGSHHIVSFG